jgi:mRNA-degrading endonuclease RelE of RelBE toxin-antitoxin system
MTGHHAFKELTKKLSPERRARVKARVAELKTKMVGALEIGDPRKAKRDKPRRVKIQ